MRTFLAASAALYMALVNLAPTALADDYLNETVETRREIIEIVEPTRPLASRKRLQDARTLSNVRSPKLRRINAAADAVEILRSRLAAGVSLAASDREAVRAAAVLVKDAFEALTEIPQALTGVSGLGAEAEAALRWEQQALQGKDGDKNGVTAEIDALMNGVESLASAADGAPTSDEVDGLVKAARLIVQAAGPFSQAQARDQTLQVRETQTRLVRSERAREILSLSWLGDMGFHLRKGFGDPANAQGANLRYFSNFTEGDDVLSYTGALSFDTARLARRRQINRRKVLAWDANIGVGGNFTSGDPGKEHYWETRAGISLRWWVSGDRGDRVSRKSHIHYFGLSGRYVESQDGTIKDTTVNVSWIPKIGQIALGVRRGHETVNPKLVGPAWKDGWGVPGSGLNENGCCCTATNAFSWQWNLQLDVDVGDADTPAGALEDEGDILRPHAAVSARLYFDGLGRLMGKGRDATEYPFLEVRYGAYYFPLEGDQYRELFEIGAKLPLSKTFSVEATYHDGTAFPLFSHTETFELALGIRF